MNGTKEFINKKIKGKSGVTLLALVVTIIILIILAGVSLSLVLSGNGILTRAKESKFKSKVAAFEENLQLYIGDKETENLGDYDSTKLSATETVLSYNGVAETGKTIKDILTNATSEDVKEFTVVNGKLKFTGTDAQEIKWFANVIYNKKNIELASAASSDTAGGKVSLENTDGEDIENYQIYGQSVQNGTPTPTTPVAVNSLGESGNITVGISQNLIKNGYGELGNNTNFNGLSYSTNDNPDSNITGNYNCIYNAYSNVTSSEYIPIDTSKKYNLSLYAKNTETSLKATFYAGFKEYDVDKNEIVPSCFMYMPNTLTYLTSDLNNGDTVIHLNNISNFVATSTTPTYQLGLIFWNYIDSTGYTYTESTYSRNVWSSLYTYSNVDKSNNTITLTNPWNHGTIKSGTKLSQSNAGSQFNYSILNNNVLTGSWKKYSNSIEGETINGQYVPTKFRPATKYIRFSMLNDYNNTANTHLYIAGIKLSEDGKDQNILINLTGHDSLRKIGDVSDYIDYANGRIVRNIGKIIFKGTENWQSYGSYQRFFLPISNFVSPSTAIIANIKSDKLISSSKDSIFATNNAISGIDTGGMSMMIRIDSNITTVDLLKSWLSSNNITVYYQLATPTYESITLPDIPTVTGTTNITASSGDIEASKINITYLKNQ